MTRSALLPVLLLSLSSLLVGCGGDDEPAATAPEPEPLSKTEFVTQAEEICAEGNEELRTAAEDIPAEPSDEEVAQFAEDEFVPNLQQQHDDLAALGAPEGDEDTVQAILDSLQEAIDVVEDDPASLLSSDDPFTEASDLAEEYGLVECAS